jgi:hypothetical protein
MHFHRWCRLAGLVLALAGLAATRLDAADSDQGFTTVIDPSYTGEELRAQDNVWALEVSLRPMRILFCRAVNPETCTKSTEAIWYLVYKIVRRPVIRPAEPGDAGPVNVQDSPPLQMCVPRAKLVMEDRDIRKAVFDSLIPEALPVIASREKLDLKSSVQMAGQLPKLTSPDSKQGNAEYGVFMFRGVDPRTTSFSVYLSGFSNAYKIGKDESGKEMIIRRTIYVPYRRYGDQYDQFSKEIRQVGTPKWIYVPDEAPKASKLKAGHASF